MPGAGNLKKTAAWERTTWLMLGEQHSSALQMMNLRLVLVHARARRDRDESGGSDQEEDPPLVPAELADSIKHRFDSMFNALGFPRALGKYFTSEDRPEHNKPGDRRAALFIAFLVFNSIPPRLPPGFEGKAPSIPSMARAMPSVPVSALVMIRRALTY